MILRVFRARLKPGARQAFEKLVNDVSIPLLRAQSGMVTLHVGRPLPEYPDEFVLVSVWTDLDSLKAFAGEAWDQPLITPGEAVLIQESTVQHYDEDRQLLQPRHRQLLRPVGLGGMLAGRGGVTAGLPCLVTAWGPAA